MADSVSYFVTEKIYDIMENDLDRDREGILTNICLTSIEPVLSIFCQLNGIDLEYLNVDGDRNITMLFSGNGRYLIVETTLTALDRQLEEVPVLLERSRIFDLLAGDVEDISRKIAGILAVKLIASNIASSQITPQERNSHP